MVKPSLTAEASRYRNEPEPAFQSVWNAGSGCWSVKLCTGEALAGYLRCPAKPPLAAPRAVRGGGSAKPRRMGYAARFRVLSKFAAFESLNN